MKIQSLSVVVPIKNCINKCKFCVSKTHDNKYPQLITIKNSYTDTEKEERNKFEFFKRLKFARDNNCNTVVLTGTGEPIQNINYLSFFAEANKKLPNPFLWIEIQTTGVMLNDTNIEFLKNKISVDTISLSISNIFDNSRNSEICGMHPLLQFDLQDLCEKIKRNNFNLRLSLNLTKDYDGIDVDKIMSKAKQLNADQLTFRSLYYSNSNNNVDEWIKKNKASEITVYRIKDFLTKNAKKLDILPFGHIKYGYDDMSVVLDNDCMSEKIKDTYKYLILRENCRLYSKWEEKSSLIY